MSLTEATTEAAKLRLVANDRLTAYADRAKIAKAQNEEWRNEAIKFNKKAERGEADHADKCAQESAESARLNAIIHQLETHVQTLHHNNEYGISYDAMQKAFFTEHEGKALPTSWQDMWDAHQSFHVKTKLATVMKEQENVQKTVNAIHKGRASTPTPITPAKDATDTKAIPPTITKASNGAKAPTHSSSSSDGKGTGQPPTPVYTAAAPRDVLRERSPYRAATAPPKTEDDKMETITQTKRGAVAMDGEGGQQSNPIRSALEGENEHSVDSKETTPELPPLELDPEL